MKVMEEEISSLKWNQTWDMVPKPKDTKSKFYKWVYEIKKRLDDSIERYKDWLIA